MSKAHGLPDPKTLMKVLIHEDNAGALVLAETLPPQHTPQSKHCHTKTVWFCEEIVKRGITLISTASVEQPADTFTKSLSKIPFEHLPKKLMGW